MSKQAGCYASGRSGESPREPRRFEYHPNRFEYQEPTSFPPPSPPPRSPERRPGTRPSSRPDRVGGMFHRISTGLFGCIVLCVFLPFISVSCATQKYDVRGSDLVDLFNFSSQSYDETAIPKSVVTLAILIVMGVLLGFVASLFRNRFSAIAAAFAGVGGATSMVLLKMAIDHELEKPAGKSPADDLIGSIIDTGREILVSQGLLSVQYQIGYWLILALFVFAALLNIVLALRAPPASR